MIDLSDRALQGIAIVSVAALGGLALFTSSDYTQTMVIGVSAFLGAFARHVWPSPPTTAGGE